MESIRETPFGGSISSAIAVLQALEQIVGQHDQETARALWGEKNRWTRELDTPEAGGPLDSDGWSPHTVKVASSDEARSATSAAAGRRAREVDRNNDLYRADLNVIWTKQEKIGQQHFVHFWRSPQRAVKRRTG